VVLQAAAPLMRALAESHAASKANDCGVAASAGNETPANSNSERANG